MMETEYINEVQDYHLKKMVSNIKANREKAQAKER